MAGDCTGVDQIISECVRNSHQRLRPQDLWSKGATLTSGWENGAISGIEDSDRSATIVFTRSAPYRILGFTNTVVVPSMRWKHWNCSSSLWSKLPLRWWGGNPTLPIWHTSGSSGPAMKKLRSLLQSTVAGIYQRVDLPNESTGFIEE